MEHFLSLYPITVCKIHHAKHLSKKKFNSLTRDFVQTRCVETWSSVAIALKYTNIPGQTHLYQHSIVLKNVKSWSFFKASWLDFRAQFSVHNLIRLTMLLLYDILLNCINFSSPSLHGTTTSSMIQVWGWNKLTSSCNSWLLHSLELMFLIMLFIC